MTCSGSSRSLIQQLAASDTDKTVQAAARLVANRQAEKVNLFSKLETVFFGLSLGSVLVLAAIGLAISFGVMGVINMARAMGVRSSHIDSLTFGLGAGIADIAGVALSQLTNVGPNVGPNLGQAYIVDCFMVVVFGGVGGDWHLLHVHRELPVAIF